MMKYLLLVLFFCVMSPTYAQDYIPEFASDECPYFMQELADDNGLTVWCGYLHVPENRDDIDGGLELELFVLYVESRNETGNAPLVYLEGGPGGAGSVVFEDWVQSPILDQYDVIFVDQRGTGWSRPALNCPEFDEIFDVEDRIETCRARLVEEVDVDLNMYNSATNAQDIHDLLVALDIPEANIYGSSYGVRLALTMMRDVPDRIRAVILDAVYPPQVDSLAQEAVFGNQAFEQLFADCEADADCNIAYPNLREMLNQAVDTMNMSPADVPDYDMGYIIEMNGDDFLNDLFNRFYNADGIRYIPALISAYAQGEYGYDPQVDAEQRILRQQIQDRTIEPSEIDLLAMERFGFDNPNDLYAYYFSLSDDEFDKLLFELEDEIYYAAFRDYLSLESIEDAVDYLDNLSDEAYFELEAVVWGFYDDDSEGMYYSAECAEEIPFFTVDEVLAQEDILPERIADAFVESIAFTFTECEIWDVAVADPIENEPVTSDIPTLILSGAYDPITRAEWGEDTAQYLPNSWHYIFPNAGHGALDTIGVCGFEIGLAFLDTPTQEPDTACLSEMEPPDFFIR